MRQRLQYNKLNSWRAVSGVVWLLPVAALLASLGVDNQPHQPTLAQALAQVPTPLQQATQSNPGQRTSLTCLQQPQTGLAVVVKLVNTTPETLPPGTRVYWQTQNGLADWLTVASARGLPPKGSLTGINRDWMKGGPCTAHYFKQAAARATTLGKLRNTAF